MRATHCTAATLRAILCFIDSGKTPKIAFDRDDLAQDLIDKVVSAVGDNAGSQRVSISFGGNEQELQRQFYGVCENISMVFNTVA